MVRSRGSKAPWLFMVPGLLALALLVVPLVTLVWQAPWGSMTSILLSENAREALRLSLVTSLTATALAIVIGTPLAWLLAREVLPWTRLWRALVVVPMLLPPVVGGVALLAAFGRRGSVGRVLYESFGIQIPFTTTAVVLAQAFVAMPFFVIAVESGFRALDRRYEDAASTLGASPTTILRRITLPLVMPSIIAGAILCWARALGEFGATITFAGNFPGVTQTMPIAVYTALERDRAEAVALSMSLLLVCVIVLIALRDRFLRLGTAT